MRYEFSAELWVYAGPGGWRFLTLPAKVARAIRAMAPQRRPAFGSVRVMATIGATSWQTSLFPDSRAGSYLLPVKAEIRKRERLADGQRVRVGVDLDV